MFDAMHGVCENCDAKGCAPVLLPEGHPLAPDNKQPVALCQACYDERLGLWKSNQPLPPIGCKIDGQEAAIWRLLLGVRVPAEC